MIKDYNFDLSVHELILSIKELLIVVCFESRKEGSEKTELAQYHTATIMNDQLEAALNTELSKTSICRINLYDEMDEINHLINTYSYYKNSIKQKSFKDFMSSNNGQLPSVEENNSPITDVLQGTKIQYFSKGDQNPPPMKTTLKFSTQSDLVKRYIEAQELVVQQTHDETYDNHE